MKTELKDGVLSLTLDSPQTNNAFDLAQAQILLKSFKLKDVRLVVLRSQGPVFCSGGNLREYAAMKTKAQGVKVNREIRAALAKFAAFPAPKIAVVQGDCFGGGIELISCCDFILSEPHVFFGMWQRKMELSFGWGGFERLSSRMNAHFLENWIVSGDVKSAGACLAPGLVNEVVVEHRMRERVEELTKTLLSFENESYRGIKNGLQKNEAVVFEKLWWSEDHRRILSKFKK